MRWPASAPRSARAPRSSTPARATCPTLAAGERRTLEGHADLPDLELLLTEVEHRASLVVAGSGTEGEASYKNTFRAVPGGQTYRPPRITPRPSVPGLVHGIVVAGPHGGDKYAQIDAQGRYVVRFLFDTATTEGRAASRPIRMMQNHSGESYGTHFPLRPGAEVLIAFINGDLDRPVIVGTVPNPAKPAAVTGTEPGMHRIRTGAGIFIDLVDDLLSRARPRRSTRSHLSCPSCVCGSPSPGRSRPSTWGTRTWRGGSAGRGSRSSPTGSSSSTSRTTRSSSRAGPPSSRPRRSGFSTPPRWCTPPTRSSTSTAERRSSSTRAAARARTTRPSSTGRGPKTSARRLKSPISNTYNRLDLMQTGPDPGGADARVPGRGSPRVRRRPSKTASSRRSEQLAMDLGHISRLPAANATEPRRVIPAEAKLPFWTLRDPPACGGWKRRSTRPSASRRITTSSARFNPYSGILKGLADFFLDVIRKIRMMASSENVGGEARQGALGGDEGDRRAGPERRDPSSPSRLAEHGNNALGTTTRTAVGGSSHDDDTKTAEDLGQARHARLQRRPVGLRPGQPGRGMGAHGDGERRSAAHGRPRSLARRPPTPR